MSRSYEMVVEVAGFFQPRKDAIKEAFDDIWDLEDEVSILEGKGMILSGKSSLCGGEGDDEFALRAAIALRKANGGPCSVEVRAYYLEEIPYEFYSFPADQELDVEEE